MDKEQQIRYKKAQQRIMSPQEVEQRKKLLENSNKVKSYDKYSENKRAKRKRVRKSRSRNANSVKRKQRRERIQSEQQQNLSRDDIRRNERLKRNNRTELIDYLNRICFIIILSLSFNLIFTTQKVTIRNNELMSNDELLLWLSEDELTVNSLYTWVKYNFFVSTFPESVESVSVKFKMPWSLNVDIEDKVLVGGVIVSDEYAYYDKDGIVLIKTEEQLEGVTVFEGVSVEEVELYEALPVKDIEVFTKMIEVSVLIDQAGLLLDEINHDGTNITAQIGSIEILFGSSNFELKIEQVKLILAELEGKSGVLNLKNYETTNDMISFK